MKLGLNFLRREGKQKGGDESRESRKLQEQIEALLSSPIPSKSYPLTRSKTADDLRETIARMEQCMKQQGDALMDQNRKLNDKLNQIINDDGSDVEEDRTKIETGSFVVKAAGTNWRVAGYSSIEPVPDYNYFPGLSWTCDKTDSIEFKYSNDRVISAIVPCFNEKASDLHRTIHSLYRQRLPKRWRLEVVIIMDGADNMDASMADYLKTLFGVQFNSGDPEMDPFVVLPDSETIVIDPVDKETALARRAAVYGVIGGYSLVVKKHNHRKANSQMWWLGPHGQFLKCTYSLATDCGTVFARTATMHLMRRMDREPNLHAVTGFQRIMTSEMQGDGVFEPVNHPFSFLLRMIQRFDFEVDHVSFKSVYDSLGCMHVIPGPCGLFRFSAMGTLKGGLMNHYFRLFQTSNKGLIAGNVELVEDRIPGTLLSFPLKRYKDEAVMPPEGWPRTGFVYDAVFYIEAEKPLSQLVKQRRRWLNGTFATYLWMLMEGIVTRSNQDPLNRFLSWLLVIINVIQGLVVRLFGPALLIVWMFRFGLFIPDLFDDPTVIFDPELNLVSLEIEEDRLKYGIAVGLAYLGMYVAFVVGHTPKAKPYNEVKILRYSEPTAWRNDKSSAYRGWLMYPVLFVNFLVLCLFIINTVGTLYTQGWSGTPVIVRLLICICFTPFILGILDGFLRCDLRCLFGMCYSAPFALPLMIWFTIWLPAYATTRLSDLTWGNRDIQSIDESKKALKRARDGRRIAWVLILCNTTVALVVILLMQKFGATFPMFVVSYTMILSFTYVISFFDMVVRFFSCAHLNPSDEEPEIGNDDNDIEDKVGRFGCGEDYGTDGSSDGYVEMNDEVAKSTSEKFEGTVEENAGDPVNKVEVTLEVMVAESGGYFNMAEKQEETTGEKTSGYVDMKEEKQ